MQIKVALDEIEPIIRKYALNLKLKVFGPDRIGVALSQASSVMNFFGVPDLAYIELTVEKIQGSDIHLRCATSIRLLARVASSCALPGLLEMTADGVIVHLNAIVPLRKFLYLGSINTLSFAPDTLLADLTIYPERL